MTVLCRSGALTGGADAPTGTDLLALSLFSRSNPHASEQPLLLITCHMSIFKVSQSCPIMGCWPAYRTDQPRNRGCSRIPTPPFNAPRSSADREQFHGTAQVRRRERRQNGGQRREGARRRLR